MTAILNYLTTTVMYFDKSAQTCGSHTQLPQNATRRSGPLQTLRKVETHRLLSVGVGTADFSNRFVVLSVMLGTYSILLSGGRYLPACGWLKMSGCEDGLESTFRREEGERYG